MSANGQQPLGVNGLLWVVCSRARFILLSFPPAIVESHAMMPERPQLVESGQAAG